MTIGNLPKYITEEEMLRNAKGKAPTIEWLNANYERIVEEAEAEFPQCIPS